MKTVRCIDFETTGFPPNAGVVEAGWTDVLVADDGVSFGPTFARLANPNMPIGEAAGKVHGISDAMVESAPPVASVFIEMADGADVFCAHNAEFERNFFGGAEKPWICTYKVALALYPDLPNHRNGDLPVHLGIELDPDRCAPLHRAGPDTYVTAMILRHFLSAGHTIDQMVEITHKPRLITKMPFGKYRGVALTELPIDYMRWAIQNMDAKDVKDAIKRAYDERMAA